MTKPVNVSEEESFYQSYDATDSDDEEDTENESEEYQDQEISPEKIRSDSFEKRQKLSSSLDKQKTPYNQKILSTSKTTTKRDDHSYFKCSCWACLAIIVLIIAVLKCHGEDSQLFVNRMQPQDFQNIIQNLENNINDIKLRFNKQEKDIWSDLEARIIEVIIKNPKKRPTIIFLFAKEDQPMLCLARMLGNASKAALNSEDDLLLAPNDPILEGNYSNVIRNFKDKVQQQKVIIFENILDIHPQAMRVFHNLCDSERPLVKEAVYILTMVVKDYNNVTLPFKKNELMPFVERQLLMKLKGKIDDDEKVMPLITRMTDAAIIHVQPEPDVKSCPIRY